MPLSPAKTLAALRQLACLGHPGALAAPEAVNLIRARVKFDTASLSWHDRHGNLSDILNVTPAPPEVVLDYLENFQTRPDLESVRGFTLKTVHTRRERVLASPCRATLTREYVNSAFYNRILKPVGYGWGRMMLARRGDGAPLAILFAARPLDATDFSPSEMRFLEQAQPWLEHLLRNEADTPEESHTPSGASATVVFDSKGEIGAASCGALELLHQAAGVSFADRQLSRSARGRIGGLLERLSRPLQAALEGAAKLPPEIHIANRWGRFHLRAYAMDAFAGGAPQRISLHIERFIPMSLQLFRAPRFLGLSLREREICLHLLAGRSQTEAALCMGVAPSTAIYFTRQVFQRLAINRQSELLAALSPNNQGHANYG